MNAILRGDTRLVVLLGHPVAHSLSPQIHNRAFTALGIPFAYAALDIPPRSLHCAVHLLRSCAMAGANVTIPHKQQVVHYCDRLSELSGKLGTVNTLYFENDVLCGTTTDPDGFLRALMHRGHDPSGGHCIILGNGGTARTLAGALALRRIPASLVLAGRNENKVTALARELTGITGFPVTGMSTGDPQFEAVAAGCTLLVNCTSAGMHPATENTPLDRRFFHRTMTVFDTIYNPAETRFLAEARAAGCIVQNGLRMLLYQALESLRFWTGIEVPETLFNPEELSSGLNNI